MQFESHFELQGLNESVCTACWDVIHIAQVLTGAPTSLATPGSLLFLAVTRYIPLLCL